MKRRDTRARTERPQESDKTVGTLYLGIEVTRCDQCDRGDCGSCVYRLKFEHWMSLPNCNDCDSNKRGGCAFCPKPGEDVRINCPLWEPKKEGGKNEKD